MISIYKYVLRRLSWDIKVFDRMGMNRALFNVLIASGGVERVERVVTRYNNWIENYGQEYKKTPKLTRAVERLRKYVSILESIGATPLDQQ